MLEGHLDTYQFIVLRPMRVKALSVPSQASVQVREKESYDPRETPRNPKAAVYPRLSVKVLHARKL